MKKLFVIGDSISIHYGPYLKEYLRGKMEYGRKGENGEVGDINQVSDMNGGDSCHVLEYLREMKQSDYDILMLNCGLHDIKTTEGRQVEPVQYEENLRAILDTVSPQKVVWVTTTPVDDEQHHAHMKHFSRYNKDVVLYNEIAARVMRENHVSIIDLYHFTEQLGTDIYADHVHYIEEVRKLQAAYIAGALLAMV